MTKAPTDTITKRGMFRDIDMKDLERIAHLPHWGKEKAKLEYKLPFEIGEDNNAIEELRKASIQLSKSPTQIPQHDLRQSGPVLTAASPQSHIGPFKTAIDFLIPDGTKVLAAQDGVIVELQEHSNEYGDGPEHRDKLNYITIQHDDGEYSQYCHLAQWSARESDILVGSIVKTGQVIGLVGKTGWTDRDHLHFIVFRKLRNSELDVNPLGFVGLRVGFEKS